MFTKFYNENMNRGQRFYDERERRWPAAVDAAARLLITAQQSQIEGLQRAVHLLVDELRGVLHSGSGHRIITTVKPVEPAWPELIVESELPKAPVRTWQSRIMEWLYELAQADKRETYTKRWAPSERDMFSLRRSAFEIGIGGYGDEVDVTFTARLHAQANRLRDYLIWKGVETKITRRDDLHHTTVSYSDLAKLGCPNSAGTAVLPPDDGDDDDSWDDDEDGILGASRDEEDDIPKRRIGKAKYPGGKVADFGADDKADDPEWNDKKRMNWAREFLSGLESTEDWRDVCKKTRIFKGMVQFMSKKADTQDMHDYLRSKGLKFYQQTINDDTYFRIDDKQLIDLKLIDASAFANAVEPVAYPVNNSVLSKEAREEFMRLHEWKPRFLGELGDEVYDKIDIAFTNNYTAIMFATHDSQLHAYRRLTQMLIRKNVTYQSTQQGECQVVTIAASDLIRGEHAAPQLFGHAVAEVARLVEEHSEIADAFMRSILLVLSYTVEDGTTEYVHTMIHGPGPTFVFWTAKQEDAEHIHHVLREHSVPFGNWFETARGHCIRISVENLRRVVSQTGEGKPISEAPAVLPDEETIDLRREIDMAWIKVAWKNGPGFEFKTSPDQETFAEWSDRVWVSAAVRVWAHQVQDITDPHVGATRTFEITFLNEAGLDAFRTWIQRNTPAGEYEHATINGQSQLRVPNWVLGQMGFAIPTGSRTKLNYDLLVDKSVLKMLWSKMNPDCDDEQIEASIAAFSKEVE